MQRTTAQIAPMFKAWSFLVRIAYLIAALVALVLLVPRLVDCVRAMLAPRGFLDNTPELVAISALLVIGFIAPATLAIIRLLRRGKLIPDAHLKEAPMLSTLLFLASVLGSALLLLVAWILFTTSPEERHGANLAAPVVLGLMLLAFALLAGECVLVPGSTGRAWRAVGRDRVF